MLTIIVKIKRKETEMGEGEDFNHLVSVITVAYNEEKVIGERIENLLKQDYPKDRVEVIIASDGSIDSTVEIGNKYANQGVVVIDFKENRGRAWVHNKVAESAKGDILIFTDARTKFKEDFLKKIMSYFNNSSIGCVVGNLIYETSGSSISQSEGLYWKFEKKIRGFESYAGILATASGACMAVRKSIWRDLESIDDCDFSTPLDAIIQDYKVVYAPDAIAIDTPPWSASVELKVRIRQTSKNIIGTLKRWGWKGWIRHPIVTWGLLSHKILRWLMPFFMLSFLVSNLLLLNNGAIYKVSFIIQLLFYIFGMIGFIGDNFGKKIPIASTVFSFIVANIGMGIGVIKGLLGKAPTAYKTEK